MNIHGCQLHPKVAIYVVKQLKNDSFRQGLQLAKKWPEMVLKWPFMSHKFSVFFLQNCKKQEIVFYVIAFDPNKIQACQAHQNDGRKLNFVKDINVVGQKMSREGHKMTNSQICPFFYVSDYNTFPRPCCIYDKHRFTHLLVET